MKNRIIMIWGTYLLLLLTISLIRITNVTGSEKIVITKADSISTIVAEPEQSNTVSSRQEAIQVVFALDATGSMSSLINTAKQKIWSIASSFAQSDSGTVQMGLVFYRDKGDEFVTKVIPLSNDIDNVYEQLMGIAAQGGGDGPESVNKGLYDAVSSMKWNDDTTTYKTIFLVGDFPPHMDYKDDVKYYETCKLAKQKDIILNTILMGNNGETARIWKDIASCSGGSYMQVGMDANNLQVSTPYDTEIAKTSEQIDQTRIYYGSPAMKAKQFQKEEQSKKFNSEVDVSTKARRAEFNSTKAGKMSYYGNNEMINDYKDGKVKMNEIPEEDLPDNMKKMNEQQRMEYVKTATANRDSLEIKLKALNKQRQEYISSELKKKDKSEVEKSFDNSVYENVKKQAEKKKIYMKGNVKY